MPSFVKSDRKSVDGFEWDERKRQLVLRERNIDFEDVAQSLLGPAIERAAEHRGEVRFIAITRGRDGRFLAVVYTFRGRKIRIVTAWPASRHEQHSHLQHFPGPAYEGQDRLGPPRPDDG